MKLFGYLLVFTGLASLIGLFFWFVIGMITTGTDPITWLGAMFAISYLWIIAPLVNPAASPLISLLLVVVLIFTVLSPILISVGIGLLRSDGRSHELHTNTHIEKSQSLNVQSFGSIFVLLIAILFALATSVLVIGVPNFGVGLLLLLIFSYVLFRISFWITQATKEKLMQKSNSGKK